MAYSRTVLDTETIRRLREKKGWTMQQAAEEAGFKSRQAWHSIESGAQLNLGLEVLDRIAKALDVKAKELLK